VKVCPCADWAVTTASIGTAAATNTALAALKRILEIQFRCCSVFFT
jgi:hypothetical protein